MSLGDPFAFVRFILVPPQLEKHIRTKAKRWGITSVLSVPVVAIALIFLWGDLYFTVSMAGACCLGLLLSGVGLWSGPSSMSSGYMNLTIAGQARRLTAGMFGFTIAFALLAYFGLVVSLTVQTGVALVSTVVGFLLTTLTLVLTIANFRVARDLLPPSARLLHQYGASGQVVGPPASWGTQGPWR